MPWQTITPMEEIIRFVPYTPSKTINIYIVLAISANQPHPMCKPSPWTVCKLSPARTAIAGRGPSRGQALLFAVDDLPSRRLTPHRGLCDCPSSEWERGDAVVTCKIRP